MSDHCAECARLRAELADMTAQREGCKLALKSAWAGAEIASKALLDMTRERDAAMEWETECSPLMARIVSLEAEVEQLRRAMQRFMDWDAGEPDEYFEIIDGIRTALSGRQQDKQDGEYVSVKKTTGTF